MLFESDNILMCILIILFVFLILRVFKDFKR